MNKPKSTRDLFADGGPDMLPLKDAGPGYSGPADYTNDEAPGAWPNGTRVRKRNADATDAHQDGAPAVVVGSIGPHPELPGAVFGYFVVWDDTPGVPTFIIDRRLEKQ